MAPAEPAEDGPEDSEADKDRQSKNLGNPTVLKAALEIVKRKKAEAVQKEEYDAAARLHEKIQQLEAQIELLEKSGDSSEAGGSSSSTAPADEDDADASLKPPARKRSLLSAPNPFRTIELLQQSGYSKMQAYSMLALLYALVFALELLLLYVGWGALGFGGGDSAEDGGFMGEDGIEEL
eukprot:TRINITY_DN18263_c0_g1_i1.p1 TRINITY_DN18263_c0_g1~~TRINITY_DN18263_c0_g1_i1.p1  ORF type:complete len:192 (-),score=59.75 TRINITY_DN18263_c0_g1_i1:58-597(-)